MSVQNFPSRQLVDRSKSVLTIPALLNVCVPLDILVQPQRAVEEFPLNASLMHTVPIISNANMANASVWNHLCYVIRNADVRIKYLPFSVNKFVSVYLNTY